MRFAAESSARWALRYGRTQAGLPARARRLGRHLPPAAPFGALAEPGLIMGKQCARSGSLVNRKLFGVSLHNSTRQPCRKLRGLELNQIHPELDQINPGWMIDHVDLNQIGRNLNQIAPGLDDRSSGSESNCSRVG
ncbi:MAG TPA: hypothetical protein VF111_14010, partial [Thermoanaerobaculia bacterium]